MKKTLLLPLAIGLSGATSLMANTVDVYITGSTAFRANVYSACTKLYTSSPIITYGDAVHGGDANDNSSTASWCMSGTPITALTNLSGSTLVIHGLFTGSIQGIQTVEQQVKLTFATPTTGVYTTNTPTIGFSDASSVASPYPASGNYAEENVCVQPFVIAKAVNAGGAITNINNVTWEQMEYSIPQGEIPLSAWTYKSADATNFVHMVERTKDSGTRRCFTQGEYYQFNDPVGVYIFDATNHIWFPGTNSLDNAAGGYPNGVVGAAGLNNANLNWGPGYVGGGDIKNELNISAPNNLAIALLSLSDSKGVGSSNWSGVISYNGIWPTAAGPGISGNTGTNDFSPITGGFYPLWGYEVLVHPVDMSTYSDQDISSFQLGSQTSPGSFLGVLNAQSYLNGGTLLTGSIENEIQLSKTGSATAIRISDMLSNRQSVGGVISPF